MKLKMFAVDNFEIAPTTIVIVILVAVVVYLLWRDYIKEKKLLKSGREGKISRARLSLHEFCVSDESFLELLTYFEELDISETHVQDAYNSFRNEERTSITCSDRYAVDGGCDCPSDTERNGDSGTNGKNDFSTFRRFMLHEPFHVRRWLPQDAEMADVVREQLFNNSLEELEAFLSRAEEYRKRCLQLLVYKGLPANEMYYQTLFIMLMKVLMKDLPFQLFPINTLTMNARVAMRNEDDENRPNRKQLSGGADVGFFPINEHGDIDSSTRNIKVVGEMKANLRRPKAYRQKDQLLIEMEALRQAQPNKKGQAIVKGFLTDMFTLNIAILDSRHPPSRAFYVAPRVDGARSFFIRILFLLCDVDDASLTRMLVESPVAGVEHQYNTRSKAAVPQGQAAASQTVGNVPRTSRSRNTRTAVNKSKIKGNQALEIIDFKLEEELEEIEEEYRQHRVWAFKLHGIPYLSKETLAQI